LGFERTDQIGINWPLAATLAEDAASLSIRERAPLLVVAV
jgi:hypothetical protein